MEHPDGTQRLGRGGTTVSAMSLSWDLRWAVEKGDDAEVERLLAEGVDVNEKYLVRGAPPLNCMTRKTCSRCHTFFHTPTFEERGRYRCSIEAKRAAFMCFPVPSALGNDRKGAIENEVSDLWVHKDTLSLAHRERSMLMSTSSQRGATPSGEAPHSPLITSPRTLGHVPHACVW